MKIGCMLFHMSHWWKFYIEPSQSNIWFYKPSKWRVSMQGTVEPFHKILSVNVFHIFLINHLIFCFYSSALTLFLFLFEWPSRLLLMISFSDCLCLIMIVCLILQHQGLWLQWQFLVFIQQKGSLFHRLTFYSFRPKTI